MDVGSNSKNTVARQLTESLIQQGPGLGQGFQRVTIESLPGDVLLVVFGFYQVIIDKDEDEHPWNWEKLVHVCQRWRYLIFKSPIRLNLQLFCTTQSPVRKLLDVWPPFPLAIINYNKYGWPTSDTVHEATLDNAAAALERRDRVCQISISDPTDDLWERIVTAMQEPFPALRSLLFRLHGGLFGVPLPDTFLNGSAPCLQYLAFWSISFPLLPRLLSSTRDLTSLHLFQIPDSGYIPPEEMATSLSALPKVESLIISFVISPLLHLRVWEMNDVTLPPTRFVLPALTQFNFDGVKEYLEVLVAGIDAAPLLDEFEMEFSQDERQDAFDIPQIIRFFGHLESFRPSSLTLEFHFPFKASIVFPSDTTSHSAVPHSWHIISDRQRLDWQVISLAQICSQILPLRYSVKSLNIKSSFRCLSDPSPIQQDDIDPITWSQLFHSFTSVHSLYIPAMLESSIAPALQELTGESAAEVLPSLRSLSIVGNKTAKTGIESFVAARQHSGRPVVVSRNGRGTS